jgi:hypothetical protein
MSVDMVEPRTHCAFCGGTPERLLALTPLGAATCLGCSRRLGALIGEQPDSLVDVWPLLASDDDDADPEPRIRRSDGTTVELRQATAELKRELSLEARLELAESLGQLGLHRERLLEYAFVLAAEPAPPLAERALELLFTSPVSPGALEVLRSRLLPN